MSNLIIAVLTTIVAVLNRIITKLTNTVDVNVNQVDVELETVTVTEVSDQLSFFAIIDEVIEEVVEIAPVETVAEVEFDYSSIIAALGLVETATPEEVVEVVEEVEEVEVVETVTVLGVVYSIRYMTHVDVRFSGRVHGLFVDAEGYLFEGSDGTSDFLLRVQAPLSIGHAREWMSRNGETKRFTTRVAVTPTISKFI